MRALIVDDELNAREELRSMLEETGEFSLVVNCADALEALQAVRRDRPDVLFLDIQMPLIGGFELLNMIEPEAMPAAVVFVTAYDEFALKAFEENAFDYLLKPVEGQRLAKSVARIRRNLLEGGRRSDYGGREITRIPCTAPNRIKLVDASEVECVRSDATGIFVVCPKGEFFTELTLKVLESRTNLVRCHKQFLVNMERVDEITLRDNQLAEIRTKSGKKVPVSRRYLQVLKRRFAI